jgi:hypothetical protein
MICQGSFHIGHGRRAPDTRRRADRYGFRSAKPRSGGVNRANSKTITGLTNGTAYAFTVKAVDTSGNESQGESGDTLNNWTKRKR